MKKILLSVFLLSSFFFLALDNSKVESASGVQITLSESEHTIVSPFEKSFRFIAKIKNNTSNTVNVQINSQQQEVPEGWYILEADPRYRLKPGEENNHIIVFEPGQNPTDDSGGGQPPLQPGDIPPQQGKVSPPGQGEVPPQEQENDTSSDLKEESHTFKYNFSWEGGSKEINLKVNTKNEDISKAKKSNVKFKVTDNNGNEVNNYTIVTTIPSGVGKDSKNCTSSECTVETFSGEYIDQINKKYRISHKTTGYYLQVAARGYKNYFESNFLPPQGESEKSITLEPLENVGEYNLINTIKSGFSIWWIKASSDEKHFMFTQGTHGSPEFESPDQTKVIFANSEGKKIWERKTGGECWGGDISPNGKYIAAGCHDGVIYVWDKKGKELWTRKNATAPDAPGFQVRWVKFSPDSKYLISGPSEGMPEIQGLFEAKSGKLLWDFYTGGYIREARFSDDGKKVYVASANGTLYALNAKDGKQEWLGSGNYYIPFVLGISESENLIIASGKGRAFTALDLSNGKQKWEVVVDQTTTAGEVATDGSVVGSTVGGMGYRIDNEGNIKWARFYGGVGHNAVYYTRRGNYALFGGPNPTLFDKEGNVLWQREMDKKIQMSGPNEINTGAAYVTWVSEDGKMLILGEDDGKIDFYRGEVRPDENKYSQLTGTEINFPPIEDTKQDNEISDNSQVKTSNFLDNPLIILGLLIILVAILIVGIIIAIKLKRNSPRKKDSVTRS